MPPAPLAVALTTATATIAGVIGLAVSPDPYAPGVALLAALGMVLFTIVSVSGTLLARSRWARPAASAVGVAWLAVGIVVDSGWGYVMMVTGAATLGAAAGPWLRGWLRRLPSSDGPPPAAVVVLLALVATPAAVALTGTEPSAALWAFAGWSALIALALARALPGALTAARLGHPLAAAAAIPFLPLLPAVVATASGLVVALGAWRRDVAIAVVPLQPGESAAPLRIPPELVPEEVLRAAGLDELGRPLTEEGE